MKITLKTGEDLQKPGWWKKTQRDDGVVLYNTIHYLLNTSVMKDLRIMSLRTIWSLWKWRASIRSTFWFDWLGCSSISVSCLSQQMNSYLVCSIVTHSFSKLPRLSFSLQLQLIGRINAKGNIWWLGDWNSLCPVTLLAWPCGQCSCFHFRS